MISRLMFAMVAVIVVLMGIITIGRYFLSDGVNVVVTNAATDLVIGQTYEVADFETCSLPDKSSALEWHFGGVDRSRRNQLTPKLDGCGRRILRKSSDIPAGTMRLRKVVEHSEDPTLEGFKYGTYVSHWESLVIDYNGQIQPHGIVRPCGPARS